MVNSELAAPVSISTRVLSFAALLPLVGEMLDAGLRSQLYSLTLPVTILRRYMHTVVSFVKAHF